MGLDGSFGDGNAGQAQSRFAESSGDGDRKMLLGSGLVALRDAAGLCPRAVSPGVEAGERAVALPSLAGVNAFAFFGAYGRSSGAGVSRLHQHRPWTAHVLTGSRWVNPRRD